MTKQLTHTYILVIKKNEILPFVPIRMDLKGIMLSEKSQIDISTVCYHNMQNLKNEQIDVTKNKQIYRYSEQIHGYQWGQGSGKGSNKGKRLRDTNYNVQNR